MGVIILWFDIADNFGHYVLLIRRKILVYHPQTIVTSTDQLLWAAFVAWAALTH